MGVATTPGLRGAERAEGWQFDQRQGTRQTWRTRKNKRKWMPRRPRFGRGWRLRLRKKDLESASEDALKQICKEYFDRMYQCESQKYDMEFEVRKRGFEINELNIAVNDLRGKFI